MSVLENQTKINQNLALYGTGGGGGGSGSFSTINVSTIDIQSNGDINWDGSLNFQGTNGGYVSIFSTFNAAAGNGIQITGPSSTDASTINLYVGGDGKATLQVNAPSNTLNMYGTALAGLSSIQAPEINSVSSINGLPYPYQAATTVAPTNSLVYAPPGGGNSPAILFVPTTAQHSYRVEFPVKIQGWSTTTGLSNNYVPGSGDLLYISPLGNVVGSPAPVFASFNMAQVSSQNNDLETFVSGVFKATANTGSAIYANTIGATYSTSVEVGAFCYLTDLGAI